MSKLGVTRSDQCSIDVFRSVVEVETDAAACPSAAELSNGVPVYDAVQLRRTCDESVGQISVRQELDHVLSDGPGILVIRGAFEASVIDDATATFNELIRQQNASDEEHGDHFGAPGANDRVWNGLEKLACADPEVFVRYYNNDMVSLGALAWLGPGYQVSSQINVVNPGGAAQVAHRDYHLGFMTNDQAEAYPLGAHLMSPRLTLQGAVAHVDMPVESGPTMYLPHSHKYDLGYLAWRSEDFSRYFEQNHHQVPLTKGDLVYFNPALFHGAGTNQTESVSRMANLMQISSAMARPMESVDRQRIVNAIYPVLRAMTIDHGVDVRSLGPVLGAACDGYAFPTNLDRDPPLDGLTPPNQADIVREALCRGWEPQKLATALADQVERRRSW